MLGPPGFRTIREQQGRSILDLARVIRWRTRTRPACNRMEVSLIPTKQGSSCWVTLMGESVSPLRTGRLGSEFVD